MQVITKNVFSGVEYECPVKRARFVTNDSKPIDSRVIDLAPQMLVELKRTVRVLENMTSHDFSRGADKPLR